MNHPSANLVNQQHWRQLTGAHWRMGRWPEAIECAKRALLLAPADPECLIAYAQCLIAVGARGEALKVTERLSRTRLERADWNDALGTLLTYCEAPLRGLPFYELAVALDPGNGVYLYNLAAAQRMSGMFSHAEANLNKLIAAAPRDARAYYMRSDLRTQTPEHNHIEEMIARLQGLYWEPPGEIMLCFALAKELEDVSRFEESFAHLQRGCARQRALISYDVTEDVATIDRIVARHTAAALGPAQGGEGAQCLFVLGLPRSGTTLVERILASHSAVRSAGESPAFPAETIRAVQRHVKRPVGKLEFIERALEIDPYGLGQAYLEAAHPRPHRAGPIVDKQPLNYLYAGLIARALPQARVIALARDPMDTCYAMYKALFNGAYPFSYDLSDLGHYYIAWHRLMRHWQTVLKERLLIVHYEDLVENQQHVSQRILAHCGLEWENACLAFDAQPGAVTSASAVQVRQPMYTSSIGKWRRFAPQLAPLLRILEEHQVGCDWRFD